MKRAALIAGLAMALPVPALACTGAMDALSVVGWTAEIEGNRTNLTLEIANHTGIGVRMVEASIVASDVLEREIGKFDLAPDIVLPDRDSAKISMQISSWQAPRLADLAQEDVAFAICTLGVVYADGAVEKFSAPINGSAPLSESDFRAAVSAMHRCWNPPSAARTEGARAEIAVALNPDGSVASAVILSDPLDALWQSTASAAQRSVHHCGPYTMLPVDAYDNWREFTVLFDASSL